MVQVQQNEIQLSNDKAEERKKSAELLTIYYQKSHKFAYLAPLQQAIIIMAQKIQTKRNRWTNLKLAL